MIVSDVKSLFFYHDSSADPSRNEFDITGTFYIDVFSS